MYSVVLMMALSGSADVPAWGKGGGCMGGGWGGGCNGGGYSCGGGWGGGCRGGRGGFLGGLFGKHRGGGCSGNYGCGCNGGYGGGYGGCSGYVNSGCGCCGSAAPAGCYGGAPPVAAPVDGAPATPATPATPPENLPAPKGENKGALAPAPATIHVSLPADAKLFVNDFAVKATGSERVLVSPTLNRGLDYVYTLKAETIQDGRTVTVSRQVFVRAGETTRVAVELPASSVALR